MNLYEARNWNAGVSYARVYVWAATLAEAFALARYAFQKEKAAGGWREEHRDEDLHMRLLFSSTQMPFVTEVSDEGWERGDAVWFDITGHILPAEHFA